MNTIDFKMNNILSAFKSLMFSFRRQDIVTFLCAFVISLTYNLYPEDNPFSSEVFIRILIGFVIHFVILKIVFSLFENFTISVDKNFQLSKKSFIAVFFILSFIFLIPLIIYYPGVNGWDTEYQLVDLFDGTQVMHRESWGDLYVTYELSDHMNLFVTLVFGAFVKLGMLFGNASIGVFIYCSIQAMAFSYVCTCVIDELLKWGINQKYIKLVFLFYAFSPFVWMYSITMIKDSINAVFFVLYYLIFIRIIRGDDRIRLKFFIISLLVCLTKKTGIIIVVPSNLLLVAVCWKNDTHKFRSLFIALSPVLIITIILQRIVYPMCNVYQDGLQETIAFSFQQIARTVKYSPNSFSLSDSAVIDRVIDYDNLSELYNYNLVDNVKDTFRRNASYSDILTFLVLWFRTAIQHPFIYLRSLIGTNGGFFSPTHKINIYTLYNDWGNIGINYYMWPSKARVAFYETYNYLSNLPIINVLFYTYFYSWILVCYSLWRTIKDHSKLLFVSFLPVYISLITFILSPDVNARYALHIIMIAPILICLSDFVIKRNNTKS